MLDENPLFHSPDMGIFGVKKVSLAPTLQNKNLIDKSKINIMGTMAAKSPKNKKAKKTKVEEGGDQQNEAGGQEKIAVGENTKV